MGQNSLSNAALKGMISYLRDCPEIHNCTYPYIPHKSKPNMNTRNGIWSWPVRDEILENARMPMASVFKAFHCFGPRQCSNGWCICWSFCKWCGRSKWSENSECLKHVTNHCFRYCFRLLLVIPRHSSAQIEVTAFGGHIGKCSPNPSLLRHSLVAKLLTSLDSGQGTFPVTTDSSWHMLAWGQRGKCSASLKFCLGQGFRHI